MRTKAGWFVALLYLLCVATPGAALALGDAASCMVMQTGAIAAAHAHGDSSHQSHSAQASGHSGHHADAGDITHERTGQKNHGKHGHDSALPGPCCAMLCVSAIAADLPLIAKPTPPISLCVLGNLQHLPGEIPPLLYRPPIA